MEKDCKSNVSYLDLRKELNLTLKQFKTKLECIGLEFKESYSESEVKQLKDFIALNLNKTELRELPYTKKGWIPLRTLPEKLGCSINTLKSYMGILNLIIYNPIHQVSLVSEDTYKQLDNFIHKFNSPRERKLYLQEQTFIKNYGTSNPFQLESIKEKRKETCIEKYGTDNPSQLDLIKNKRKETLLKHYGVTNPMESLQIRQKLVDTWKSKSQQEKDYLVQKTKDTKLKRYGNENYNNSKQISETYSSKSEKEFADILSKCKYTKLKRYGNEYFTNQEKTKQTCLKKYGVENSFNLPKVSISNKEKYKNLRKKITDIGYTSEDLSFMFNKDLSTIVEVIAKLGIKKELERFYYIESKDLPILEDYFNTTSMNGISYSEKEVVSFIQSICSTFTIRENVRDIISPKELDIYIPEKKLAIEFDGLYWHDELHTDNNYHFNKTKLCREKGIDLIHIFEDDWLYNKDIVKSMIASRLGVYQKKYMARKLKIKEITKFEAKEFFNNNHLQGFAKGDIYLALIDNSNDIIQSIIVNNKGFHDGNTELTRMATKLNTQVVGGFSKLMKHLVNDYNIDSVISYVYSAWFNGKGYINSGFKVIKENLPSYYYIYQGRRVHKSKFRKSRIEAMYNRGELSYWNKDESEHENMLNNNIYRIYDCGTIKVEYKR